MTFDFTILAVGAVGYVCGFGTAALIVWFGPYTRPQEDVRHRMSAGQRDYPFSSKKDKP